MDMNLQGALARLGAAEGRDRISAHRDPIRVGVWMVALWLIGAAALLRGGRLIAAVGEAQRDGRSAHNSARSSGSRPLDAR
jgi:hypothetical protein